MTEGHEGMYRFGGYEDSEQTAEFYDACYSDRSDVGFFVDLSREANGRTPELGCGTGRVLIPAAEAGCQITGLDASSFMLDKCREKVALLPKDAQRRIKLVRGDMAQFDLGERFALVTMPFRPFQHIIAIDDQKSCLSGVNRHLDSGGGLVFDVFNPSLPRLFDPRYHTEQELTPEQQLPDGRRLRRAHRVAAYHRAEQYNEVEIIHYVTHPDGRIERDVWSFPMRYFFRYELEHLLDLCGFRVVELLGDFDRSEFEADSPEMIFVAEKR
jgi:SAM-dependent methyltransferase